MRNLFYNLIFCLCLVAVSCAKDDGIGGDTSQREEVTVAIILPYSNNMEQRWRRTAEWATNNIDAAQSGIDNGVTLKIEWYDEDSVDIEATVSALSEREDICAIIGPMYSDNVSIAAAICSKAQKTLISTTASSAELVRAYAGSKSLWALTETDITQCEVLLSKAKLYGAERVSLLAKEDSYGQTFIDWFAFQAMELGLEVADIAIYTDGAIKDSYIKSVSGDVDYTICIPSSLDDFKSILKAKQEYVGECSRLLFSDVAYNPIVLSDLSDIATQGIEGVAMYSDPSSGFAVAYEVKYGEIPQLGEAQAFDALMMVAYGAFIMNHSGEESMNDAICKLVDGRGDNYGSWMVEHMNYIFTALERGESPNISGASGSLDFDSKVYTNVLQSVYANWMVYEDKFVILDYNSSDGGNRVDETLAGWNWNNTQTQEFEDATEVITYPALDQNWALIVAASTEWKNYRHQADALEIYQMLKQRGYQDDHIILIMEDDIARNSKNPSQGEIISPLSGENLYRDIEIDYKPSTLSPYYIERILLGEESETTPNVIKADKDDDVLVFWSGHGEPYAFNWGEESRFTHDMMESILEKATAESKFRKMLWLVEACFSGSVASASDGYDGVMFITAANQDETSKADIFNEDLKVWMTNRFTTTLITQLDSTPDIIINDLFYKLFRNTVGSHVTVYNNNYYGNLHIDTMGEYMKYY